MLLLCLREEAPETRVALTPEATRQYRQLGLRVAIEKGAGNAAGYLDREYKEGEADIVDEGSRRGEADIVVGVRPPSPEVLKTLKKGALLVSFLDPFNNTDLLRAAREAEVSAVSMEMMPRTTLAQKMDAISSQANLAGYMAVIMAAERLGRILPMMMTPAGTISPSRVFVIGVGVAGLQAIATAKRLGARVEAFDTRPVVEEQVKSLGARFLKIDLGETGQTEQGYAKELTEEQKKKQREGMAKACEQSDIVITTAKVFGRKPPVLVTENMLSRMRPGSIVVDLAAEAGGNVEGVRLNEEAVTQNGVRILGYGAPETYVAHHASQVYAANLMHFITHFWNSENVTFDYRMDDPILKGCLITRDGDVIHESFASGQPSKA